MFDIYATLNDIQSSNNVASICETMGKITKNANKNQIINLINIFLIQGNKTNSTKFLYFFDKLLEEYNSTECEVEGMLSNISNHLQNTIDSKNKNVRKNTLTLLILLFKNIEPEDEFIVYLCERLFDKKKEIVKKAVCLLSKYQNVKINKKDYVYSVYKDLLKHDPNGDVRRLVLKYIQINEKTISSVIEKIIDRDSSVRNVFYNIVLQKIKIKELKKENFEFMLEKCMKERELNYKDIFVDKVIIEYNFIDNFFDFIDTYNVEKEFLCIVFDKINVKFDKLPTNANQAKVYNIYLEYIEERDGRDFLKLFDLDMYLEHINKSVGDYLLVCELLRILKYYDFVTQSEKKTLNEFTYNLLLMNICDEINDAVFALIKKYLQYEFDHKIDHFLLYIFKYNLYNNNFDFFYNKIKETEDEYSLQCLFYICKNNHNFEIPKQILECKDLKILTDLFISYKLCNNEKESVIRNKIDILVYKGIKNNDTGILLPIMKLLISGYVQENELLIYVLQNYYTDLDDHLYQYTTLFLNEYIITDANNVLDVFIDMFMKLDKKKIFVNQMLYWIGNSTTVNGLQKLCYKICLYLLNTEVTKKNAFELVNVLNNIECTNKWELNMTKKMLYCAGQIIKKIDSKTLLNNFIVRLMMVDDGTPLDKDAIQEIIKE
ncbi:chromosome condensation complex Condensin [Binucleata daphniae]